jgi:hypothetical protein
MKAALVILICAAAEIATGSAALVARTDTSVVQTCRRDQSGIDWALPFEAAHARAKAEQRLLLIKPIAFGTSSDGGW